MRILPFEFRGDCYYFLEFGFNKRLIEEVKYSLYKRRWSPKDDTELTSVFKNENGLPKAGWWCPICPRNSFVIDRLNGVNVYERYDIPLITMDENYEFIPEKNGMWLHQEKMKEHILTRKACIIAAEPRTGKTRPSLTVVEKILSECTIPCFPTPEVVNSLENFSKIWFVTRLSAVPGIYAEMDKWNLEFCKKNIDVMTYHRFRNGYDGITIPRIIFYDECQGLRDETSIQSKTALDITKNQIALYGDDCYRVLMSGTPAPKAPSDWYNLCEIACPGFLGPRDKTTFANELGEWEENSSPMGQKYYTLLGWKRDEVERLPERLKGLVLTIRKKDCMDLPDIIFEIVKCSPDKQQIEAVKFIKTQPDFNKGAMLALYLREIADGFMYSKVTLRDDNGEILYDATGQAKTTRKVTYIKCGKDALLRSKLDEYGNSSIESGENARLVVYCGFQATVDKVTQICLEEGWVVWQIDGRGQVAMGTPYSVDILRREMDRSRDEGLVSKLVVVAQEDAAGTGMEFSSASIQIGYSNGNKADSWVQALQRPHSDNMDKIKGLSWINFNCMPIDNLVYEALKDKKNIEQISLGDLQAAAEVECWYDESTNSGNLNKQIFETGV